MNKLALNFYKSLLVLACISMFGALVSITLNIVTRLVDGWYLPGLDGYAGYFIAAALFLALPSALLQGDHIRVTLVLQNVGPKYKKFLEYWSLIAGLALGVYLAWFSCRLVWMSYTLHDIAPTGDASPLWIPQLSMALGAVGFAIAFLHALIAQMKGKTFFETSSSESSRAE